MNRYVTLQQLGDGTYGSVVLGQRVDTGEKVTILFIVYTIRAKSSLILETFLRNLVPRFPMFFILCEAASLQFVRQLSLCDDLSNPTPSFGKYLQVRLPLLVRQLEVRL